MPTYVYACPESAHTERKEVIHSMGEEPEILCPVCGQVMQRVPQAFRWYKNPSEILLDMMDDKYRNWRKKKARQKYGNKR